MKADVRQRFRYAVASAGHGCRKGITILSGYEVVWVDGISAVEVVLVRHVKTGRLVGINTCAMLVTAALPAGVIAPAVRNHVEDDRSAKRGGSTRWLKRFSPMLIPARRTTPALLFTPQPAWLLEYACP